MHDFEVIKSTTPVVIAKKKNDTIATVSNLPVIYHKDFDINEFIGEELSNIRGVNSVHYFPVLFDGIEKSLKIKNYFDKCLAVRVGSFDFKVAGIKYVTGPCLPFYGERGDFEQLLELCKDDKNRDEFLNELLECYGLDIFCGQLDRPNNIYYEFHPNGEVHLSKMFDYEHSFDECFGDYYITDFHIFRTIDDYQEFMIKYPKLEEILRSYLDVDLVTAIKRMASLRNFNINGINLDKYDSFNDATHKKLEKILK